MRALAENMRWILLLGDSNFHYHDGVSWYVSCVPWLSAFSTAMFVERTASAVGVGVTTVGWRNLRARSYERMALQSALSFLDQLKARATVVVALGQNDALDFTSGIGERVMTGAEEQGYESHVIRYLELLRSDLLAHDCVLSATYLLPFDHSGAAAFHPSYPKLVERLTRVVLQKTARWKWRTMTYVPSDTAFLADKMHLTSRGRKEFADAIWGAVVRARDNF